MRDTNKTPPIVQASWSEKVNNAYFQIKDGDIDEAIGNILIVIGDLKPLIDEIMRISRKPSY